MQQDPRKVDDTQMILINCFLISEQGHHMQNLNVQFESLRQSPTVAMADRILALKASGREIIGLQVGDPDF